MAILCVRKRVRASRARLPQSFHRPYRADAAIAIALRAGGTGVLVTPRVSDTRASAARPLI
jgi:hypothetical protein